MGRADVITNEYMSDNNHFADIFNYYLYDGQHVIEPTRLRQLDKTEIALPFADEAEQSDVIQRYRDVFKLLVAMEDEDAAYVLLGIENQTHVHYAMPARNMLYDAAQYVRQVELAIKEHRNKKDVVGDEYLSGFAKDDMLLPVITLVIYWSPNEWDGPKSIHEMVDTKNERILKYVPDYRINLITPKDIIDTDFKKFNTELAEVLQFIKYSKNKEQLREVVYNDPDYERLDRRTVEVINEVTGSNINIPKGAKEVNMCVAIEEMKREAAEKAAEKAAYEASDRRLVDDIKKLMKNLKMTADQAMDALEIALEDRKNLIKML